MVLIIMSVSTNFSFKIRDTSISIISFFSLSVVKILCDILATGITDEGVKV